MSYNVECPAEECEYTGTAESVCGHYGGKRDEKHSGGYEVARRKIDYEQSDSDPRPRGSNPIMSNADSEKTTESDSEEADSEELLCLECGGELVDFTQYTNGEYHEVQGSNVYVRGDYVCADCGGWFVNE